MTNAATPRGAPVGDHTLVPRRRGAAVTPRSARATTRVAATCSAVLGVGFGAPCAYGIAHLAQRGEIATVAGYPTYGNGPFEGIGVHTTVPLLGAFLGVCLAEIACGWLLWNERPAGRTLAWWLLPLELPFWIGFALPYAPVLGAARTVALLAAHAGTPHRRTRRSTSGDGHRPPRSPSPRRQELADRVGAITTSFRFPCNGHGLIDVTAGGELCDDRTWVSHDHFHRRRRRDLSVGSLRWLFLVRRALFG